MPAQKGENLEELVRDYFSRQGFFVLRSIKLVFEDDDVTDVDVWSYGRQSANVRTRTIIDVKNKTRPKAFERILWTRGMQLALGCDRGVVATTDNSEKAKRFAKQQKIALLNKRFLERLNVKMEPVERLTLEQFTGVVTAYREHKSDGDWLKQLVMAKSALISLPSFPAFNRTIGIFSFFASRVQTRTQHRDEVLRCTYLTAAISCIALDSALASVVYEDAKSRYNIISNGITYGDTGDGKVQRSVDTVLSVISESMENGRVIALRAGEALDNRFKSIRADIIAEFFSREHNAANLFAVARELEAKAHGTHGHSGGLLSVEARAILGVFADFVGVSRKGLTNGSPDEEPPITVELTVRSDPRNPAHTQEHEQGRLL